VSCQPAQIKLIPVKPQRQRETFAMYRSRPFPCGSEIIPEIAKPYCQWLSSVIAQKA
jgi:hypothetical protein